MDYSGPWWRDNGAIFVIIKSIEETYSICSSILEESEKISPILAEHYDKWKDDYETDEAMSEFCEITDEMSLLESKLSSSIDTAILMCCIALESRVNMFCYFNIGEETTDAIETLNLVKKIEVAHRILRKRPFKGTKPYEAINDLVEFRNLYAHGKCTDRPKDKIRKNHLTHPDSFPEPGDKLADLIKYVEEYLLVNKHLSSISEHQYTSGVLSQHIEIQDCLDKLKSIKL